MGTSTKPSKLEAGRRRRTPKQQNAWAKKLGPLAPIAVCSRKANSCSRCSKLKSLLSLATFMAFYWALYGPKFGVGFALLILVHEMGHYIDIKRRGLPAEMPMFSARIRRLCSLGRDGRFYARLRPPSAWPDRWPALLEPQSAALIWWNTGERSLGSARSFIGGPERHQL